MSRPTKIRRVCCYPDNLSFSPATEGCGEPIILTVDEYETIRLIDKEGLSQEESSLQLGVGRTTVQKIYDTARKKLADALVLGLPLRIEGGDFRLCSGNTESCYKRECKKNQHIQRYQREKGEAIMRVAVTYANGEIFQHFGHTEQFKLYDIEDGRIVKSELVSTNDSGHGALARVLSAMKADVLICGGIGSGAQMALADAGIKLYGGASGSADAAVSAFISGQLDFDPDVRCGHHKHGAGHSCGEHSCGGHCGEH